MTEIDTTWKDETSTSYIALKTEIEIALNAICEKDKMVSKLLMRHVTEETEPSRIIKLLDDIIDASEANAAAWLKVIKSANMLEKVP